MTAQIININDRAIRILSGEEGWLACAPRGHCWAFGDKAGAVREAEWLSRNFNLPVREVRHEYSRRC
jgi:hypothetical protein